MPVSSRQLNNKKALGRVHTFRGGSRIARTGANGGAMEADGGTVDYWQTSTCNPSDAMAYTSVEISAWWTSFGGYGGHTFE